MSTRLNDLLTPRSPEELLAFLACWTQQLLIELQFQNHAGPPVVVPTDVTLAVNLGLEQAGRTAVFIRQADFDSFACLRALIRAREEAWWQLH